MKNLRAHLTFTFLSLFVKQRTLQLTELFNLVVSEPSTGHPLILEAWEEVVKWITYAFFLLVHLQNCFINQLLKNI